MRWPAAYSLAVSDDGSMLACTRRYDVVVVDLRSRQIVYRCRPVPHPSAVAFSPDARLLAVASVHGITAFLDAATGAALGATADRFYEGCAPKFAADGRLLVGDWNGDLTLNKQSGEVLGREQHQGEMISRISHDAARRLWLIQHTRRPKGPQDSPSSYLTLRKWPEWDIAQRTLEIETWVESATLSPNGRFIAYLKRWWDPVPGSKRWGTILHVLKIADNEVVAVRGPIDAGGTGFELAWSPDDRFVGVVKKHGFSFFDMKEEERQASVPCRFPSALAFLPNGKSVVLGTWERSAVFDLDSVMAGQCSL